MEIAKGFRGSGRYTGVVRAARAYLAGFGTTGSLLAGAALMFIVASALVAFHGWPHVAVQPSPGEVVVSPRSARSTGPSASARRLAAALVALPVGGTGTAAAPGAGRRGGSGGSRRDRSRAERGERHGGHAGEHVCSGRDAGGNADLVVRDQRVWYTDDDGRASAIPAAAGPAGDCRTRSAVALAGTGQQVGSVVQQTTSSVAGAVGGSSSPVGGAVEKTGSGAAKTVTGLTQGLGGLVSGLGVAACPGDEPGRPMAGRAAIWAGRGLRRAPAR